MAEIIKNLINGKWQESFTKETFESMNPADTSDGICIITESSKQDVDMAVQAARDAFKT